MMYFLCQNIKTKDYFVKYGESRSMIGLQGIHSYKIVNQFGRHTYANIWRDFYNRRIDLVKLRQLLQ